MNEQREKLEAVANTLAMTLIKIHDLKVKPEQFKIFLSHDILPTAVMKHGDPVQVILKELDMVEALVNKGKMLSSFQRLVLSCLRTVPRLHPSTCLVVPPKLIKREDDRWLIHKGEESDLFPNLVPEESVNYKIRLYVEGKNVLTGRVVRFMTHNLDVDKMRRDIRELLS